MIEQLPLSLDDAKKIVLILKSNCSTPDAWDQVYAVFHDSRGLADAQERTVTHTMNYEVRRVTIAYDDSSRPVTFGLYDSSTNSQDNVTRAELLKVMNAYVLSFKTAAKAPKSPTASDSDLVKRLNKVEREVRTLKALLAKHSIKA